MAAGYNDAPVGRRDVSGPMPPEVPVTTMPRNPTAILLGLLLAGPAAAADWPTLRGSDARHGFYTEFPAGKLRLAWRHELHRELTGPRAEVIVAGGKAFLGTYAGTVYAWDAATGKRLWTFRTGGPVWHSPAYRDGTLFVGSADRFLYALDAADGSVRWKYECDEGVTVAPAVAGGLVLFGDRGGTFHAVRVKDGKKAFAVETGGPVQTPAAVTADGSACVFASEDMHAYCVELPAGKLWWKSRKLAGVTCRDYPPVLTHGLAFFGTAPVRDFHRGTLDADDRFLVERTGFAGKDKRYIAGTAADVEKEQDAIVKRLTDDPSRQTFYAFRLDDGKEPWVAPVLYTSGLHNPPTPPCVNPDTGEVFVILRSAYSVWDGGGEVRSFGTVGKLDHTTGRVKLIEHSYRPKDAARPPGVPDIPYGSFPLIGDETQSLSCAPGRLFSNHQGTLGELDLKAGTCRAVWGKRDTYGGFYGPGTFGWENQGGEAKAEKAGQPFALVNEWHGPARGVASVAGGRVYLNVGSQVVCLEPEGRK
jgi:outer membrane protein assembly factor BamB